MAIFILLLFAAPSIPNALPPPVDRAWSILKEGTAEKSSDKRAKAVHALGLLPKVQLAESMAEKALADENRDVRAQAASALGQMLALSARPKLHEALKDKDVKVVFAAANALYALKDADAYEVYYEFLTGQHKTKNGLIQSQVDTLHNTKQVEKLVFQTGIGFVPFGGMGYEAWKTITHDDSSAIRALAAERLASDPDPRSADALIEYCTDKRWQVRAAVVNAIAKRDDPALTEPVIVLLADPNDDVRYDAAATIIHLSRPRVERRHASKQR